jgi:hypothetical protein
MNQQDRAYMEKIDGRLRGVEKEVAVNTQTLVDLRGLLRWGIGLMVAISISFGSYVFSELGDIDERVDRLEAEDGNS